jgi:hypothetical protein
MLGDFHKLEKHHQIIFAIVIAIAVVGVWRGLWGLMDVYLLPNNYVLSCIISLIIGLLILLITHYAPKELM